MSGFSEPQATEIRSPLAAQRRVVFEHTVEGLFLHALRGRLSRAAERRLREQGLDLSKKLLPAYPIEQWRRYLEIAVVDLYPFLPRPEGYRRLGHELVEGMGRTVLGRAMVGVARLLGPRRALRRIDHTFHSADNYVASRLTELSPTCCEVWINEVMEQPGYYQGILEACLQTAGARESRVEIVSREGSGATFRVEWQE